VGVVPKYLKSATFSKDSLCCPPAFCWRYVSLRLDFTVFTYRPTSLLATSVLRFSSFSH